MGDALPIFFPKFKLPIEKQVLQLRKTITGMSHDPKMLGNKLRGSMFSLLKLLYQVCFPLFIKLYF